jgi:cholesterol transport system auxiliary component
MVAIVGACAQPPLPEDHFYRLQVATSPAPFASPPLAGVLEVERFVADGLTAGRPIVWSKSGQPHALSEYHYHFWVEAPTVLLRDQLVVQLRAAKVAKAVVTPEMRVNPDFVLSGKIQRLERVVGTMPQAVVELELAVRRTAGNSLSFMQTYRAEEAVATDSVAAAVAAINKALGAIYAKFTADLTRL